MPLHLNDPLKYCDDELIMNIKKNHIFLYTLFKNQT